MSPPSRTSAPLQSSVPVNGGGTGLGSDFLDYQRAGGHSETVLDTIIRVLRNRKWIVVQALVIVPLAVLLVSMQQEEKYTAKASLLFRDPPQTAVSDNTYQDPDRKAATNTELVDLPEVANIAARTVGRGPNGQPITGQQVDNMIALDTAGRSDVVNIQATSTSPELAAKVANAYGEAYPAFRRRADRAQLSEAITLLNRRLESLTATERAGAEGRSVRQQLTDLELRQSLQTGNAELVSKATVPSSPSSPNVRRNVMFGIILGGALGFALASLLERFDRRIKTVEDLERQYALPILARIPRSRAFRRAPRSASDALDRSAEAEAFRMLRANLRFSAVNRDLRSLLIVSPVSGDGKSTIARFLAMTMAYMGDRVALVETDLHKSGLTGSIGEAEAVGLSSVIAGASLDESLIEVPLSTDRPSPNGSRKLVVLPAGPVPPNPSELLESERMREIIDELERRHDIVIFDTPPLSVVSDALSLVPQVSGVIIVSGLGHTTRDAARELTKQLALLGQRPLGVVANFAPVERGGYYYKQS